MKKSYRNIVLLPLLVLLTFSIHPLFSEGSTELADDTSQASRTQAYAGDQPMGPTIISSTSWVTAIVESSGGVDVTTLAPNTLKHPPEYDFSPKDIITATKADILFWAGYEGFMKKLFEAAQIDESKIVLVHTGYTEELLSENIRRISALLGNKEEGEQQIQQIAALFSTLQEKVSSLSDQQRSVIVQAHQQPFIESLGYNIVATIGPGDVTLTDVQTIEKLQFSTIIDNYHSPSAQTFQNDERTYVQLLNFPGPFGTDSIISVITYNAKLLGLLDT
jgi:zinc transport system substrate-binding protein